MLEYLIKSFAESTVDAVKMIAGVKPKRTEEETHLHIHQYSNEKANEAIRKVNHLEAKLRNSQRI